MLLRGRGKVKAREGKIYFKKSLPGGAFDICIKKMVTIQTKNKM